MQRRAVLGGALLATAALGRQPMPIDGMLGPATTRSSLQAVLLAFEAETGGRIGLAIRNTGDDELYAYRGDERFPMCSSFKALLAACVLARADHGQEQLARPIAIARADILDHSPFGETRSGATATVAELARAAVVVSDNAAANLLLAAVGGPGGLTRFLRSTGDPTTRLDRIEPDLNQAAAGDPRDTSTPRAMVATLRRLLLGDVLEPASRHLLTDWMFACETGRAKLRAGLPADWRVADKTGAGEHGSDIDMALVLPPGRTPLLVASYLHGSAWSHERLATVHARIGKLIALHFV